MKKKTLAIDVSKDKLDFCAIQDLKEGVLERGVIGNDEKSISKWLDSIDLDNTVVAMEHTGHYSAMLAWLLSERNACFHMINPLELKRSMGMQRGKSDAIDAYRIAAYTIRNSDKIEPFKLPAEKLRKLKALMSARKRYVKISVQLKNSLKANQILNKTIDVKDIIQEEKKHIRAIEKSKKQLEKQMIDIIKSSDDLHKTYKRITKVIGVGPITATMCIIETDNFSKFPNGRKFGCHCGVAPFPRQSGSSVKGKSKTHPFKKKSMRAILFKAARCAKRHDPQLRAYYDRKIKEGKNEYSVLNAVAFKLILRIFAVAGREEPFVKLAA